MRLAAPKITEDFNLTMNNEVYKKVPEEFPLINDSIHLRWKFLQGVKSVRNYCPLSPGCPKKTVVYSRNKTFRNKCMYVILDSVTYIYLFTYVGPLSAQ